MIINPVVLFVFMWLGVLILYLLSLSGLLEVLNNTTIVFVLSSCFIMICSYFFYLFVFRLNKKSYLRSYEDCVSKLVKMRLKIIFAIWLILSLFEVYLFKGIPLLSLLFRMGGNVRYTDFGVGSLHGLLNACLIFISNYLFYLFLKKKRLYYLFAFLLCLLWPILLVSRQVMMSMIIQAGLIYVIFNNNIGYKKILTALIILFVVIFSFGAIGDVRSGRQNFINLAQPTSNYPGFLPSGFLWAYVYITTPLGNVNYNIENLSASGYPYNSILTLLPSVVRSLPFGGGSPEFKLPNPVINVCSFHEPFLRDFGIVGSIGIYFLLGLVLVCFYYKAKRKSNIKWKFILVVVLHNVVLSVFTNFFTHLAFIVQIAMHYFINIRIKTKTKANNEI